MTSEAICLDEAVQSNDSTTAGVIKIGTEAEKKSETKALSVLLKDETTTTHESLDQRIMRADPFGDLARYKDFLKVQYAFHWVTEPLYSQPELLSRIPLLSNSCRLDQVIQDCLDMGIANTELQDLTSNIDQLVLDSATALGWLYTLEGSNIGAAFLFKFAKKVGLSETFGAAHLAGNPEGRGRHWNSFKDGLNAIFLTDSETKQACDGAAAAFQFVRSRVEQHLP